MEIAVFIKQVPDTTDVKWTKDNNIDRTNMDSIINPEDKSAIECALILKDKLNAHTTAITMGPQKAQNILSEAIAMGIDDALLLCDSKFAGSDTCATSNVLASAIKNNVPEAKIIIFGQTAIDGETGQTGVSTAVKLNLPFISRVSEIIDANENEITVISESEKEKITYKAKLPVALCISDFKTKPRLAKIDGYMRAQEYNYTCAKHTDLNLQQEETGIKGSPTYVSKVYKNDDSRCCKFIESNNTTSIIEEIKGAIK